MSLDKAVASGHEHRQPYRGSARFDSSCRHGGDCPWCQRNRQHAERRRMAAARDALREVL